MTHEMRRARHQRLMTRMADALGVDLDRETLSGRLPPETLETMVDRCTGCSNPDGCERVLGAPGTVLAEAPAQCRNAERLVRLLE